MKKVLAIAGYKGSGKDTAAEYLVKEKGFTRVSFADCLKDMTAEQYNLPIELMHNQDLKEKSILSLPVDPKDDFSIAIAKIMFKELRDSDNKQNTMTNFMVSYHTGKEQLYWTPRALLILEGSIKRSVTSNYWVDRACKKISDTEGNVVIPDLRYRSEVEAIKAAYGSNLTLSKVFRGTTITSIDPSERDLNDYNFEYKLDNTGTVDKLYKSIDSLVNIINTPTPGELV